MGPWNVVVSTTGLRFDDLDEVFLGVEDEQDTRSAFGRPRRTLRLDIVRQSSVKPRYILDFEPEVFRPGLVHVIGVSASFGVVFDEFDATVPGVQVDEVPGRTIDPDGARKPLSSDAKSVENLQSEDIAVELGGSIEVGYGHAEVVCVHRR